MDMYMMKREFQGRKLIICSNSGLPMKILLNLMPVNSKSAVFVKDKHPWEVKCDIAMPCATQNELDEHDARDPGENGCICVCEGANMPSTPEAIEIIQKNGLLFAPEKLPMQEVLGYPDWK